MARKKTADRRKASHRHGGGRKLAPRARPRRTTRARPGGEDAPDLGSAETRVERRMIRTRETWALNSKASEC